MAAGKLASGGVGRLRSAPFMSLTVSLATTLLLRFLTVYVRLYVRVPSVRFGLERNQKCFLVFNFCGECRMRVIVYILFCRLFEGAVVKTKEVGTYTYSVLFWRTLLRRIDRASAFILAP